MSDRKNGNEPITFAGEPIGYTILDFWSWNSSDLLDNTLRGNYSEFVVAAALGLDLKSVRRNWEPWDLTYSFNSEEDEEQRKDIRIEVKSSSYLQAWDQVQLSNIVFSIRPTRAWDAEKGFSDTVERRSDVYVFCLYAETDTIIADPLDLNKWEFYVISTAKLNELCGAQKEITLSSLERLEPIKTAFPGIKTAVRKCFTDV